MNILKKTALGACITFSIILLLGAGLAFGLHRVFGSPEPTKTAMEQSGIYQAIVDQALTEGLEDQSGGQSDELPLDDPEIQAVIRASVPPALLQTQVEGALDSSYAWLRGETRNLEFEISFDGIQASLADGIEQHIEERLSALPVCDTTAALTQEFDRFTASCLPPGVTAEQAASESRAKILEGEGFGQSALTADDIASETGTSLDQQFGALPAAFQAVKWSAYVTTLLALVFLAGVVVLSVNRRAGLKKAAVVLLFVGVVSAGLAWLAGYGVSHAGGVAGDDALQESGIKVAQYLTGELRGWWMGYGIALVVAGVATLVVLRFTRPKTPVSTDEANTPPRQSQPENPDAANHENQKPKPARKLVQ